MQHDTAGDPITGIKWSRRTTRKIADQLATLGIAVSKNTVGRLLKQLHYKLRVNRKQIASSRSPVRNQQFLYMGEQRQRFASQGLPILSVDSKKKELIGNFRNPGAKWDRQPQLVKDHDFRSEATALATPRGIYDLPANRGSVFVGLSHDTPEFAVDTIAQWWQYEGRLRYPQAHEILVLADAGGSIASRSRAWKKALQDRICNALGLTVTVSHYPPGTSKWNPIEHRLFSEISKNWAGQPLTDLETMLNFIGTTKTATGLAVSAYIVPDNYECGNKVSDQQMREINLLRHDTLGLWNYSVRPTPNVN
ncbi:MAG TPA: ISAzo13 family transposase [Terriglobales bacterium]